MEEREKSLIGEGRESCRHIIESLISGPQWAIEKKLGSILITVAFWLFSISVLLKLSLVKDYFLKWLYLADTSIKYNKNELLGKWNFKKTKQAHLKAEQNYCHISLYVSIYTIKFVFSFSWTRYALSTFAAEELTIFDHVPISSGF